MGQASSAQFTPVQVLHAARRAEAEGKMDYALQFYRHLVEQHAASVEAQEAREGLFRIAEWRWGEGRAARRQEAEGSSRNDHPHAYSGEQSRPPPGYSQDARYDAGASVESEKLPQVIQREKTGASQKALAFKVRYRAAKIVAFVLSGFGWATVLAGIALAAISVAGAVAEFSVAPLFGVPLGVLFGVPAVTLGLILIVAGHLAVAVFENANATLELVAIERSKLAS